MTDSKSVTARRQYRFGKYIVSWKIPQGYGHKDAEGLFACSKFADGIDLPSRFTSQKYTVKHKFRESKSENSFSFRILLNQLLIFADTP